LFIWARSQELTIPTNFIKQLVVFSDFPAEQRIVLRNADLDKAGDELVVCKAFLFALRTWLQQASSEDMVNVIGGPRLVCAAPEVRQGAQPCRNMVL